MTDPQLTAIIHVLNEMKAIDIVTLDVTSKTQLYDQMVIASGQSSRQLLSIADKLVTLLKEQFNQQAHLEGGATSDWVLVDAGNSIIHLFRPEIRQLYHLEKIWSA